VDVYRPIDLDRLVRRRVSPRLRVLLGVLGLLVGFVTLIVCVQDTKWVGSTDLEVRFIVTDASSGQPVDGATISIHQEGYGFCDSCQDTKDFSLTTGANGTVSHRCRGCMCWGSSSVWRSTFRVHVPTWRFSAATRGHAESAAVWLQDSPYARQGKSREKDAVLEIPIHLAPAAP
jgi:hypothetical protein